MLVHIPNVLDAATLAGIRDAVAALRFIDGKTTAGWHAKGVKNNIQAEPSPALEAVQGHITAALLRHPVFASMALPARLVPPLVSRTGPGQGYGSHVDDAVMGKSTRLRADISVTVFLCAPETYGGGELIVETPAGEDMAKFPAGDAVIYPSTTLHRVAEVTDGERLVAATWVQSLVRDAAAREILFDLDRARRSIFERDGKCETFDLVSKAYSNLLRRWAGV